MTATRTPFPLKPNSLLRDISAGHRKRRGKVGHGTGRLLDLLPLDSGDRIHGLDTWRSRSFATSFSAARTVSPFHSSRKRRSLRYRMPAPDAARWKSDSSRSSAAADDPSTVGGLTSSTNQSDEAALDASAARFVLSVSASGRTCCDCPNATAVVSEIVTMRELSSVRMGGILSRDGGRSRTRRILGPWLVRSQENSRSGVTNLATRA